MAAVIRSYIMPAYRPVLIQDGIILNDLNYVILHSVWKPHLLYSCPTNTERSTDVGIWFPFGYFLL